MQKQREMPNALTADASDATEDTEVKADT